MAPIFVSATALIAAYIGFDSLGAPPDAARWLTGASGAALLICYGLARI